MEKPVTTLEGWYCEHLTWHLNWQMVRQMSLKERQGLVDSFQMLNKSLDEDEPDSGSHCWFQVNGFKADLGLMVLRPTLDALNQIENQVAKSLFGQVLQPAQSFVSVTEAGTYAGKPKTDVGWSYVNAHLKPQLPAMHYLCFYPMSKRRWPQANWYTLPYQQRQQDMHEHGQIGRRFAGQIKQYITGAIGFDDDEWGVTLFSDDPLAIKKIVSEMRYAAASSIYGEFPYFIIGSQLAAAQIGQLLTTNWEG